MALNWYILNTTWRSAKCILICAFVFSLSVGTGFGGTWRDSFENGRLFDWRPSVKKNEELGWENVWRVQDNMLEVRLVDIRDKRNLKFGPGLVTVAAFLELTAIELQEEHFVVEGISIKTVFGGEGFGIAIGQRAPSRNPEVGTLYLFHTRGYKKLYFDKFGGFKGLNRGGFAAPRVQHLKVIFDTGRFRSFSADKIVTDLFDKEFKTIDLLGLMLWADVPNSATMDEFVISGPGITDGSEKVAVHSMNQLATTWGSIKRRSRSF